MRLAKLLLLVAVFGCTSLGFTRADVTPHPLFSDNMVLQQGVALSVFGKGKPGEKVTVQLGDSSAVGVVDKDGAFSVTLPAQKAATGLTLRLSGDNVIEFKNVAVGEVWVCSGQSNMEWSVDRSEEPAKVKEKAKDPSLRLFTVQRRASATPLSDPADLKHLTGWVESDPSTVGPFSAVAYHFGRKLRQELGVPVGLIHTSWGGTPAQAWTSIEALQAVPSLKYYAEAATTAKLGPNTPGALYNAMIHPLLKFRVKGAIWYQGESNTGKAFEYRTLLPTLIEDWRKRFDCELPFMIVQLAPFRGGPSGVDYAELRDAQLHTAQTLKKVGLAVITDVGNETDIHPKPKQPVGERLALAALGIEYGKKIVYSGPVFRSAMFEGPRATLSFDHVGGGLVARDGNLTGFTVAGADGVFHPAEAVIMGDKVVVSSDKVEKVTAVRYGWANFPKPPLNFFNKEGLPAAPFRTDDAPYTTMPKAKK